MQTILDIEYSQTPHGPQHLHLFLPDAEKITTPLPVVVWFVGGGWQNCEYKKAPTWLVEHGFAVISVQYRVTSIAPGPACIHDAKAALRWVRAQTARYPFDPRRVGVWGSSAGAHLTLLLALTPGHPQLEGDGGYPEYSSAVSSFCCYASPTDLVQLADAGFKLETPRLREAVEDLLGGPIAQRLDMARLFSPIRYVSANCPPGFIIHGTKDVIVPYQDSTRLHGLLKAAGAPDVSLLLLENLGHGWDRTVTEPQVLAFFKRTLGVE